LAVPKALLTTSCTSALEMASYLLNVEPSDEVIVPSFTFVSTANAFVSHGAKPVFIDVNIDTLNMDESKLESLITCRTKLIVPVHYGGVSCEMREILKIAYQHDVEVVEDNAHGLLGKYRGKYLGTFGSLAALSFMELKNFTCGEGGALLVNRPDLVERAEIIWQKGTNRSRFFRGEVDKYTWVDVGSSYLPSELQAAYLYAQLEAKEKIQSKRKWLWDRYYSSLEDWAIKNSIWLPCVPTHCEQTYHIFYMLMPSLGFQHRLISHLKSRVVTASFHYVPLHLSEMGRRFGYKKGDCPTSETVADTLVRLPLYYGLTGKQQNFIIKSVKELHWAQSQ